jgi:hypothetical protein
MPKSIPKKIKNHKALFSIAFMFSCQKKAQKKPIKMIGFSQNDSFTSRLFIIKYWVYIARPVTL